MKTISTHLSRNRTDRNGHLPILVDSKNKAELLASFERIGIEMSKKIHRESIEYQKALKAKKMAQLLSEHSAQNTPIPIRYETARLADIAKPSILSDADIGLIAAYVNDFNNNQGRGVVFCGNVGAGKTHTACAIANELTAQKGSTVFYANVTEIIANIVASKSFNNEKNEYDVINAYKDPDLLIIDDIGLKQLTQSEISVISSVIDVRSRNNRPIIAISNLPHERFDLAIGGMAASRITGHDSLIINFNGEDLRKAKSQSGKLNIEENSVDKQKPTDVLGDSDRFRRIEFADSDDWVV